MGDRDRYLNYSKRHLRRLVQCEKAKDNLDETEGTSRIVDESIDEAAGSSRIVDDIDEIAETSRLVVESLDEAAGSSRIVDDASDVMFIDESIIDLDSELDSDEYDAINESGEESMFDDFDENSAPS